MVSATPLPTPTSALSYASYSTASSCYLASTTSCKPSSPLGSTISLAHSSNYPTILSVITLYWFMFKCNNKIQFNEVDRKYVMGYYVQIYLNFMFAFA